VTPRPARQVAKEKRRGEDIAGGGGAYRTHVCKKLGNILFGSRKSPDLLVLAGNFLGVVQGDPGQVGVTCMAQIGSHTRPHPIAGHKMSKATTCSCQYRPPAPGNRYRLTRSSQHGLKLLPKNDNAVIDTENRHSMLSIRGGIDPPTENTGVSVSLPFPPPSYLRTP
jgi:hypothetical protein